MKSFVDFFPLNLRRSVNSGAESGSQSSGTTTAPSGEEAELEMEETASSSEVRIVENDGSGSSGGDSGSGEDCIGDEIMEASSSNSASGVDEEKSRRINDGPPTDDCCPICFGSFVVPCRAPCGHWYCGGCILQYWNFCSALKPCKCPMCSQQIIKLTPEGSLYQRHEVEVTKVLGNVNNYNRLFVGGFYGLMLKLLATPLFFKRMFREMLNPDRIHLNELRAIALFLGILYTQSPIDFLRIGYRNAIDYFDYSAYALSVILYFIGWYLRQRQERNVRELAGNLARDE